MKEDDAMDFYNRVVGGTKNYKTTTLTHKSGTKLEGVEVHPVSKVKLASVIERLPDEMFEAVEGAEGDAEIAEEEMEGDMSAVTKGTVEAFEDLVHASINHEGLSETPLREIVEELSFEVLFELGTEIIDMSVEETGSVQDFQELQ